MISLAHAHAFILASAFLLRFLLLTLTRLSFSIVINFFSFRSVSFSFHAILCIMICTLRNLCLQWSSTESLATRSVYTHRLKHAYENASLEISAMNWDKARDINKLLSKKIHIIHRMGWKQKKRVLTVDSESGEFDTMWVPFYSSLSKILKRIFVTQKQYLLRISLFVASHLACS